MVGDKLWMVCGRPNGVVSTENGSICGVPVSALCTKALPADDHHRSSFTRMNFVDTQHHGSERVSGIPSGLSPTVNTRPDGLLAPAASRYAPTRTNRFVLPWGHFDAASQNC